MANDFSGDDNCKAVWNLESEALITDSKGNNTLTNQGIGGVAEDTTNFKQGSCSGLFVKADSDRLTIQDSGLDSGFPLKYGETNKTFSIPFWIKLSSKDVAHWCINKSLYSGGNYTFIIFVDAANKLTLYVSENGTAFNAYAHASALSVDTWYHVTVTYDGDGDDGYRIRIWDDTAGAILGTDKTGTASDIFIGVASFALGYGNTATLNGNLDEVVVFNDVLSVAEIDAIRAGTYGAAAGTTYPIALTDSLTLTDVFNNEKINNLSQTETITLTETLSISRSPRINNISMTDTATLTDIVYPYKFTEPQTYNISETDTETLTDIISIIKEPKISNLSFTETTTLSDTISINRNIKTINLSFTETTTLTDAISINREIKTLNLSITDETNLTDAFSISKITNLFKTDTETLTDTFYIKKIISLQKTESLNLTDTINLKKITNLSVTETINLTDTFYPYKFGPQIYNLQEANTVSLTDVIQINRSVKTFNNYFSETINLTDTSSAEVGILSLYKLIFNPFTCNFDWVTR
ncbi:MAG: LamG domain-containing protein [Chloroflexi bacterium]|nr:LamG domain-containing protein [Chloroflexota bacterium]